MTEFNFDNMSIVGDKLSGLSDSCYSYINGNYKVNALCVSREVCGSLTDYYVHVGIVLIISWVVVNWASWYILNNYFLEHSELERANWMIRIKFYQTLTYIIFIANVVILNWK